MSILISTKERIDRVILKHLAGQHNQKTHGNRGSAVIDDASYWANRKINEAKNMEPRVSSAIQSVVKKHGGELRGFDFRVKSEASLTRKIRTESKESGMTAKEYSGKISDSLRYTMVFDPKNFGENVKNAISDLRSKGFERYDHKWVNYFGHGNAYQGYNTVWIDKKGRKFELQFHTPESHRIKEKNHLLYEEYRLLPSGSNKGSGILEQMKSAWKNFIEPDDWASLEGDMIGG